MTNDQQPASRPVEYSSRITDALDTAIREIVSATRTTGCAILLTEGRGAGLSLVSSFGEAEIAADARAVIETLGGRALAEALPVLTEHFSGSRLAVPLIADGRALGAIVVKGHPGHPYSAAQLEALAMRSAAVVAILARARAIEHTFRGTAASPGIGTGTAVFRGTAARDLLERDAPFRGPSAERARVRDAFQKTRNDIARTRAAAARELGEEQALIFGSHLELLDDPMLKGRVDDAIAANVTATAAVAAALEELEQRLCAVRDPYFQERIEDLDDLRSRILEHLVIGEARDSLEARIVVSRRATPSLVMELKAQGAHGLVAELGGTTSHAVLLARSFGIPTVTGAAEVMHEVRHGERLIVDGTSGTVIARPDHATRAEYRGRARELERERTEFTKYITRPARTADGVRLCIQANVALGVDLALAKENGAEGIGLYRTEFPFIVRGGFPTRDAQVRVYRKAYVFFPEGPIVFRIVDLAGDKLVPSGDMPLPANAFHGYRSIRVLFDYPHFLVDQVQAFAIAAGHRPLRILIPMVSSLEELRRTKDLIAGAIADLPGDVQRAPLIGAMVETPAAVEIAADLAREVDFFSIGTNDLIQYTLVVDREDPRLASSRDAYHPAILRMVRRVVQAAHAHGRTVSVCGEMAARPDLGAALVALGVDALSVPARAVPELKRAFASVRMKDLARAMDGVLARSDVHGLMGSLRRHVEG